MRVYEIFNSIDGEVNYYHQGVFSTFIRLAGCNLRCKYCDTAKAQEMDSGVERTIPDILQKVSKIGCRKVTITGGEPLLQEAELGNLIWELAKHRHQITIETNGSLAPPIGWPVHWVVDYKCPSAGTEAVASMLNCHYSSLDEKDFVKFVLGDGYDYNFAKKTIEDLYHVGCDAKLAFSTCGLLEPKKLIEWMQRDRLYQVIVNVQLHKIIGVL